MSVEPTMIADLVRQIVEKVHPLRIILFGSAATGQTTSDSDVDMLVLMPDGTARQEVLDCIYRDVHSPAVPFDVLVATPTILERHRDNIGLIYREILRTGRVVYAAGIH